MKLGIIGLTNSGKTTLFNALTKACAPTSVHLFSTSRPNIGIVAVPDERLTQLSHIFSPKKTTSAYIEFVDIAGLTRSIAGIDGKVNQFFSHIREVDALLHIVRCFSDENIAHVEKTVNPARDIGILNLELIISDLGSVENRITSIKKQPRNTDPKLKQELEILNSIKPVLEQEIPARNIGLSMEDLKIIKSLNLLTLKPVIYCANISEEDLSVKSVQTEGFLDDINEIANMDNSEVINVCAKIEEEISILETEDKDVFMSELGIMQSGLDQLVEASYKILGLISFLTAGPDEVRAWTIKKGDKASRAAGKIHSDIERGFIRAETIPYPVFMEIRSFVKAKEKGLVRSEGKEYVVNDGDIIDFRFNV